MVTVSRDASTNARLLVFRVGSRLCALPLRDVVETMRPSSWEPTPGAPAFVRGSALIRGQATPIVDLRELLGADVTAPARRLITVRAQRDRIVGVLVDDVLEVRDASDVAGSTLPPLLGDAASHMVAALGRLDGELLTVLGGGHHLPEVENPEHEVS